VFGKPYKLLVVSTGNITNADLLNLFRKYLPQIETALQPHRYVELTRTALLIHR
jgi:predicted nuclease of predicted toxin-antitoxin system